MSSVGGASGGGRSAGNSNAGNSSAGRSESNRSESNRSDNDNRSDNVGGSEKSSEAKSSTAAGAGESTKSADARAAEAEAEVQSASQPTEATRAAARRDAALNEASVRAHFDAQIDKAAQQKASADVEAMAAEEGWKTDPKAAAELRANVDARLAEFSPEVRGQIGQTALEPHLNEVLASEDMSGMVDTTSLEVAKELGAYLNEDHIEAVQANAHNGMDRARREATVGAMNDAFRNGVTEETRMAGAWGLTTVGRTTMSRAMNGAVEGVDAQTFADAARYTQNPERTNYVLDELSSNGFDAEMAELERTPTKLDPGAELIVGALTPVAETAKGVVHMVQDPMGTLRAVRDGAVALATDPVGTVSAAAVGYKDRMVQTWEESPSRAIGMGFTEGVATLSGLGGAARMAASKLRPGLDDVPTAALRADFADVKTHPDVSVIDGLHQVDEGRLRNALADPEAAEALAAELGSSPRRVQRDAAILMSRAEAGAMAAGEVVPAEQLAREAGMLGHQVEKLDATYRLDGRTPEEVLAAGGFKPNPTREAATLWEHTAKGVGGGGSYVSTSTVPGNRNTLLNSDFWDGKIVSGTRPEDLPDQISSTRLNPEPLTYQRYEYRIRDTEGVVLKNADYPDEMEAVIRNADPSQIDVREVRVTQRWKETIDADPQFGTDYIYELTPMKQIADEDIFRSGWTPLQ